MILEDLMADLGGTWENDVALAKHGHYIVRLATRVGDVVTITEEALRTFPELTLANTSVKKKLTKKDSLGAD